MSNDILVVVVIVVVVIVDVECEGDAGLGWAALCWPAPKENSRRERSARVQCV